MVTKEILSFKKMKPLCDIEEKHRVEIGASYRNDHGYALFVEAIAADLQGKLKEKMSNIKFFSLLLDGSTDCSNVEELFLAFFSVKIKVRQLIYPSRFYRTKHTIGCNS